ncbi:ECF RNA polymerase sigma factor SigK [Streptomyces sp. NPDC002032]|uniref:ECF RNA polymerase sigma factor SigK n=1 Tax=Streptomyces sp. NPDC002032 TaxID=3364630 RepID=UPI00367727FB
MDDVTRARTGAGAGARTGAPPGAGESLADALGRAAGGDEAGFVAVYEAVAPAVLGVARAVLRDGAQAEEVTQEVFVEVWRTAGRYRADRGSVRTWVLTMAHRRAVDRVRSAQAATDRERRAARLEAAVPEFDEVTEAALEHEERTRVRRCLEALTPRQRQSLILAYYRGRTQREVSEELAVPLGTVKTRLRDGLLRLRDCLGVRGG